MHKLINAYLANPTERNVARLRDYLRRHPLGACMLLPDEFQVLLDLNLIGAGGGAR